MNITQKDIDDLVYNFKWSKENFKDKKVTDIYRQGIYDVVELMKQKSAEKAKEQPTDKNFRERYENIAKSDWFKKNHKDVSANEGNDVTMVVYADEEAIISRLDKIIELLSWKPSPNIIPYPYTQPITYDTNKIYCDTASKEGGEK